MAQTRIFVSHSHKDDAFTNRLVADLKQAGATVWVDVADIGAGDFQKRINDALSACEYVIVVLTENALASPWVEQEVNAAIRLKHQGRIKDILPILASPVDLGDIPPLWGVFNMFDATRDYASVCSTLVRALGLFAAMPASPAPAAWNPEERAEELYERGHQLCIDERDAEAIPFLEQATQLDPRKERAWVWLAIAYLEMRQYQDALAANERVLALNPNDEDAWSRKGYCLHNLGIYENALAALKRSLVLNENSALAWFRKGLTLSELARDEEAIDAYDRALAINPKYAAALSNKANSLRKLGRIGEAEVAERQAKTLGG